MTRLLGFTLVYGVPGLFSLVFWLGPIRRLISIWEGRDVMEQFRPHPHDVAATESELGVDSMEVER